MTAVAVVMKLDPDPLPESSTPPGLQKATPITGAIAEPRRSAASSVMRRWRQEDLLERSSLLLRFSTWFFSLISGIIMATNRHGDWRQFDHYDEYRYVLAIVALAFLFSTVQVVKQLYLLSGRKDPNRSVPKKVALTVDFVGDQVIAYLLVSALSAAIPVTNRMREGSNNMFTNSSSASISMGFFAFVALALSALISGFRLSKQTYI